jgi:RNA polymerase sigma factor (sigma-70 family)
MTEEDWLAERFEENRTRLRAVAYRMLGSGDLADDAVQDSWFRVSRTENGRVENLAGWLTTVVARVCLDMLRSRKLRREDPLDSFESKQLERLGDAVDPEHEAVLADSVGLAVLVVLETLTPAERVAFVLHDVFDLSFVEIAPIVERTPAATRQLASRARRRVRGATNPKRCRPRPSATGRQHFSRSFSRWQLFRLARVARPACHAAGRPNGA